MTLTKALSLRERGDRSNITLVSTSFSLREKVRMRVGKCEHY
jgi:hypothetical protein